MQQSRLKRLNKRFTAAQISTRTARIERRRGEPRVDAAVAEARWKWFTTALNTAFGIKKRPDDLVPEEV